MYLICPIQNWNNSQTVTEQRTNVDVDVDDVKLRFKIV